MASAKVTILGLEEWMNHNETSLFSDLTFPEGIVKEDCVNACLLAANEFESLYADPNFLKEMITLWGKRYYMTFSKWVDGFASEFSPIDNYDRHEEYSTNEGYEDKTTYGKKDTMTFGKKDTMTFGKKEETTYGKKDETDWGRKDTTTYGKVDTVSHAKTDTHEVSAANSSTYQAKDRNTEGGTTTSTLSQSDNVQLSGKDTVTLSGKDTVALSGSDSSQLSGSDTINGKKNFKYSGRIHGNIGVTTSTDVLSKYTDFYKDYNLYNLISDCFVSEFCIMIY